MRHRQAAIATAPLQLVGCHPLRVAGQFGRPRLDSLELLGYSALDLCQQVHRRLLSSGWCVGKSLLCRLPILSFAKTLSGAKSLICKVWFGRISGR